MTAPTTVDKLYSVSQLKLYEQCPLRYRYYYIDRLRPTYQWVESFVGARVHESLEYLYLHLKEQTLVPVGDLIQYYARRWEQLWSGAVCIRHRRRNREWYRRYGEKCLRRYYVQHYPFREPGIHLVEVEWPFQMVLDQEGHYLMQGHVDRLTRRDDNSFIVHDYKTSPRLPKKDALANDLQPGVYQLAVRKLFPEARRVMVSWHYLATQKEIRPTLSSRQLDRLQSRLIRQIEKIERDDEHLPRLSKACHHCEYRRMCPAYRSADSGRDKKTSAPSLPEESSLVRLEKLPAPTQPPDRTTEKEVSR